MIRAMRFTAVKLVCTAFAVFIQSAHVAAEPVRGIMSKNTQPVAPRGGVLMIPLSAEQHGTNWPATIELIATGANPPKVLTGFVAWMVASPAPHSADRRWTADPRGLRIRDIQPEDDSTTVAGDPLLGPYLLARVPHDLTGQLRLDRQVLQPDWRDVPNSRIDEIAALTVQRPDLPLTDGPDRPDPYSPFEYWRWALLAERLEMTPPTPPQHTEVERLAAEHFASVWRVGFDRLSKQSPRVAEQCRNLLTQTCIDRRQPFAAWIADPARAGALLARLLDFRRGETAILSDAVDWIDQQPALMLWPEADSGERVRLAVCTTRSEPVVATMRWTEQSTGGERPPPPVAVQIEPGVLMQVSIDRAPLPKPRAIGLAAPPEPQVQTLQIEAAGQVTEVSFGPRVMHAKPPGVFFRALTPPLTLLEAQWRQQRAVPEDHATFAHVRRLGGRWELFIECRRVQYVGRENATPPSLPETVLSFDDLRGVQAITILLGDDERLVNREAASGQATTERIARTGPVIWLTIPETGFWKLVQGHNDGTLQIHRMSYSDRWLCRIVLPEAWFSAAETSPALLGFIRSHDDSEQLETAPNLCPPWRIWPTRAAINLDQWDDLPGAEE